MENVLIDIESLKSVVRESVREAIREERLSMIEGIIPYVSKEEMADIITNYGIKPSEEEFIDMTNWVKE